MTFEEIQELQKGAFEASQLLKAIDPEKIDAVSFVDSDGQTHHIKGDLAKLLAKTANSRLKTKRDDFARQVRKANQDLISGEATPAPSAAGIPDQEKGEDFP